MSKMMHQVSIGNLKNNCSLDRRWLIVIIVLGLQVMVMVMASIGSLQPREADVTLIPVAGKPDTCQIGHVSPFSDAWINGIQSGMQVRAIPNPFFSFHKPNTVGLCTPNSQEVDVQIIGQNTILHMNALPQSLTITDEVLPYLLMIIFSLTGVLIYFRTSNRPVARAAFGLFSFTSLIFFIADIHTILWTNILIYILGQVTWGLATTFVCLLPHPSPKHQIKHKWRILPYLPLLIGSILTLASLPSLIWFPWIRTVLWLLTSAYTLVCIVIVGWIMFWGLRRLKTDEKQVIRIVVIGITFLLLMLAVNHNVAHYRSFVFNSSTHAFAVPLMLLPIVCAYALMHHQLLGTTGLFGRRIIRIVLWFLLASFFVTFTLVLSSIISSNITGQRVRDYYYAGVLLLDLCLFPLAWNAVRNIGDQLFYHDFYEYNRSLQDLSAELARFHHLDEICTFVLPRLTEMLNATGAALLVYSPEYAQGTGNTNDPPAWRVYLNAEPPFLPLDRLKGIANLALTHLRQPSSDPLFLDGVLLLTLYNGNQLSGFLCFGSKLNFEPYSRQDKSFLATLAAQLSVLEVNSRYLEQAQSDAQKLTALNHRVISAQEDERKRLALELHDEVLQHAILLVRQLSDASNIADIAEAMPLARSVVSSLRQTCLELRPPLLDELGLEEAFYWLARQTEQRAERSALPGLRVDVACIDTTAIRLPDQVELAFYRVVQEALSNVLKHSGATRVMIRLRYSPWGAMSLLIWDNGHGFLREHPANEQLGLIGMQERMSAINGQLQLRTHPGGGVIVRALYQQATGREAPGLLEAVS